MADSKSTAIRAIYTTLRDSTGIGPVRVSLDSRVGTRLPESVFAPCSHAGGLLGWLEAALPPLPFAMCFSAAEERPGGILALPNGFLKTLVAKRYGDELARYAELAGFERVEIVVDPTVLVVPL